MKKTILIGASVFALMATPAFAQVGSVVDQNGNSNTAEVSQTATGFTDSYVTQVGVDNAADVDQSGDDNNSTINQRQIEPWLGTAGDDPSNSANVVQTGDKADVTIDQTGNNFASTRQGGLNNDAFILQIGGQDGVNDDNQARVFQDGGENQVAAIAQIGSDNDAQIDQNGQGSGLNLATIAADFVNESVAGAAIAQFDDGNVASIDQTNTSVNGGSLIVQFDGENEAHSTQTGLNGFSEIYQFGGSGNFASVDQGGVDADSFIVQNGNNNQAMVGQVGGSSFVSQAGDGNVAHVTQGGGAVLPAGL